MNTYKKGFVSGFFLCLSIIILIGATKPNSSDEQKELLKKLEISLIQINFNWIKFF